MKPALSIIIPCYNCERTLRESVDSCYDQGLSETEFEIIMVDDGSKDGTKVLMEKIAQEHPNIRVLFHSKNRGGGAARNTGINAASGEVIYCLDSDNVFAAHSVKPMLTHLKETGADGVAFYERRFFIGTNRNKYSTHLNTITDRSIKLFDLLNGSGTLLDNFFYTKAAYLKTPGYPEHHGFDTQSFELRFLAAGNTTVVCPASLFWHRQAGGEKSYFERVYESGEYSLNQYYMFEDIFHLLSTEAREFILNYNVFSESKLGTKNLLAALTEKYQTAESALFNHTYTNYLQKDGFGTYIKDQNEHATVVQALWLYQNKAYCEANDIFMSLLAKYPGSVILPFNILRCAVGARGTSHAAIEKETLTLAQTFTLQKQKIDLNPNVIKKIAYKIKTALS